MRHREHGRLVEEVRGYCGGAGSSCWWDDRGLDARIGPDLVGVGYPSEMAGDFREKLVLAKGDGEYQRLGEEHRRRNERGGGS